VFFEMKLILASSSPRRIELLRRLGLDFEVVKPLWETRVIDDDPVEVAELTALEKARAVAGGFTEGLVIGADTIVVIDDEILGKPRDGEEARLFLRKLSGRVHRVITGIAVVDAGRGREEVDHEVTEVKFKELSEEEIELYIASGEPFDKAGGYGIQGLGSLFVEWIKGDYFNVVGLPIYRLSLLLRRFGFDVLRSVVRGDRL